VLREHTYWCCCLCLQPARLGVVRLVLLLGVVRVVRLVLLLVAALALLH
jgi:hypothetical protein